MGSAVNKRSQDLIFINRKIIHQWMNFINWYAAKSANKTQCSTNTVHPNATPPSHLVSPCRAHTIICHRSSSMCYSYIKYSCQPHNHGYISLDTDSSYLWGYSRFLLKPLCVHSCMVYIPNHAQEKTIQLLYNVQLPYKGFSNSWLVDLLQCSCPACTKGCKIYNVVCKGFPMELVVRDESIFSA